MKRRASEFAMIPDFWSWRSGRRIRFAGMLQLAPPLSFTAADPSNSIVRLRVDR
jgi:hypothetical protein